MPNTAANRCNAIAQCDVHVMIQLSAVRHSLRGVASRSLSTTASSSSTAPATIPKEPKEKTGNKRKPRLVILGTVCMPPLQCNNDNTQNSTRFFVFLSLYIPVLPSTSCAFCSSFLLCSSPLHDETSLPHSVVLISFSYVSFVV